MWRVSLVSGISRWTCQWVWFDMPVISTFRMLKSKNCEFKATLSYRTGPLKYKEKEAVDKK